MSRLRGNPVRVRDFRGEFDRSDRSIFDGKGYSDQDNQTGVLAWSESYLLMAYVEMYRATKDPDYLRRLVSHFDRILTNRDDVRGKVEAYAGKPLAGWGSSSYSDNKWHVWIVHTGMITAAPAEFVRLVAEERSLKSEFGAKGREYQARIEESLRDAEPYWRSGPAKDEGYYYGAHVAAALPVNQQNALGLTLIAMAKATGNRTYRDHAERLARYFKRRLRPVTNGAYDWAYWPRPDKDGKGSEDISHAGINVLFAARCEQERIVFNREDLSRFAETWLRKVLQPDGTWAGTVAGTGDGKPYMPFSASMWSSLCSRLPEDKGRALFADTLRAFANEGPHSMSLLLGIARLAALAPRYKAEIESTERRPNR